MRHLGYSFDSPFCLDGKRSIIQAKDLGVVNGHLAVGTPQTSVAALSGLYAPPFASSNFSFDVRFMGEIVGAAEWEWLPNAIWRAGRVNELRIETLTALPKGKRAAVMAVELTNEGGEAARVFVQGWLSGGLDFIHQWEFGKPTATKEADLYVEECCIRKVNNDKAWCLGTSVPGMRWFDKAMLYEGYVMVAPGQTKRIWFDASIGMVEEAYPVDDREEAMKSAFDWLKEQTEWLFSHVPRLSSNDLRLVDYYNRCLMHYITNQWRVEEFLINPYYANGSINGGCLCCYLWDYSGGWSLHPLVDPQAEKEQIKQFLAIDLSRSFAFTPVDGAAYGPWYPINQEKIIALIYYYIRHTGDTAFLSEKVNGRTVLEHVKEQAWLKDDPSRPVRMYDYGVDGEHHLELRRGIPYHGVLPDLNARRYLGYTRAAELIDLAGEDGEPLRKRAQELKEVLRRELWDDEIKWFHFKSGGRTDTRYTVQMYKLIGSPVLDDDMLDGLMKHWNEEEFLSEWGLHSMSKLDPAYDQIDIDNGGGGICTLFTQLIAEKLYQAGKPMEANDVLRRTLWWAERMPYMGDSFAANAIEYRQDTPYQCAIGAVSGAQAILFGMCGISADFDGTVSICPAVERLADEVRIEGMKLRGKVFDLDMRKDCFTITCGEQTETLPYGVTVILK